MVMSKLPLQFSKCARRPKAQPYPRVFLKKSGLIKSASM